MVLDFAMNSNSSQLFLSPMLFLRHFEVYWLRCQSSEFDAVLFPIHGACWVTIFQSPSNTLTYGAGLL